MPFSSTSLSSPQVRARAQTLNLLVATIGEAIDLYASLETARRNARLILAGEPSPLWALLETHLVSWMDAGAARVQQLGGDARIVLDRTPPEAGAVERELYDFSLLELYSTFCAHLRRSLYHRSVREDEPTFALYADLLRAAEINRWFVEVDLAPELTS